MLKANRRKITPSAGWAHLNAVSNTIAWPNNFYLGATRRMASPLRARRAVGFLGPNVSGDYQAPSFPGQVIPFSATTYDGGKNLVTVTATPNVLRPQSGYDDHGEDDHRESEQQHTVARK